VRVIRWSSLLRSRQTPGERGRHSVVAFSDITFALLLL
jgi:hypothetical protein